MKSCGVPKRAVGSEVAHHLVAPGAVERVLGHAHQLDVRVALLEHVRDQLVGELAPVEERRRATVVATPRAGMQLVDVDRLRERVALGAGAHPLAVGPVVALERGDDRAVAGPQLHGEAVRVGLEDAAAAVRAQLVLVLGAGPHPRNEQLPDARRAASLHGVPAAVPEVERPHHAHALRIRCPHREARAVESVEGDRVCAELVVDAVVVALAEQVQVEVRQLRREVVGVVTGDLVAVGVVDAQSVGMQRATVGHAPLEQAGRVDARERSGRRAVLPADLDPLGVGLERAHEAQRQFVLALDLVVAEQRARLGMPRLDEGEDVGAGQRGFGGHRGSLANGGTAPVVPAGKPEDVP
jgi:hypothetical protein